MSVGTLSLLLSADSGLMVRSWLLRSMALALGICVDTCGLSCIRNPPILRRLDRIFLLPELFFAFPSSSLVLGPRHLSDHAPLLLALLRGRPGIGHVRFRFELWWLRDDFFVATVPNWWARAVDGRWAAFRLSRKLHLIRREVIAWKRFFWSGKFSEVADWYAEFLSLQASENISAVQSSRLLCLQCLTQEWRIRESIHWQQRSRLGWLAHGDQNSRLFHLAASQRRRQTLLQSMNIGGRVFLGDDIQPALSAHFREFYSKPLRFHATLPDFHISPLSEFNQATCVLVPKRLNPTDVTHFRPISILGTPYKIIAKLLSLRLAPVLPSIINPFQVAFVKGRRLQDAGDFFSLERGLRQGCPLSPLLFNLVAERFSALFHHATVVGFLTPHSLPHLQTFSTLQYADDFLMFGCASRQQIVRTWLILRVFELISGLSINSAKCHISLIHADPAMVLLAEACFGCKATSLPMDYLGLQITLSPPAPSFWNGVEQKLTDRLQCWQGKLLSLPGRITLAKHCLASVPLHALVVFRPLVAVLRRFDKLIRKFNWDGDRPSDRLAHWDVVAFPRLLGSAGVTNLSRASESSLCSWWWRLATEQSPITQFISSKFDLPSPSVWNASISHTSPSHFWCDMLSVLPLFFRLADLSSSTSPSWPLSPTREFTFSSCYLASFGPSVASIPPRSLWSPGPSSRAIAFVWLLLTGHINTFDHLQRLGISLANQCPLCLVATESRVHLFTSCPFFSSVLAYVWPSLVSSLPNPPSIRLLFLFCPSPHLTASWGQIWRPWLISAWWRIWEERNNRVFRDTFSSPDSVARIVQGDVQFAIRLRRRCPSAAR
ncbi:reverse transcriptase-like protein [Nymphaea thermarum]|nr:reverse transcriptase-like protein [Nymphaea thermarum]